MENGKEKASGGIGFGGLLTIAFIVLKLTHVIDWSWVWVLAPLWIPIALALLIIAGAYIYIAIKGDDEEDNRWK